MNQICFLLLSILLLGCTSVQKNYTDSFYPINVSSTAFENGATIPIKYTCDGDNINPPLTISDIPLNTKSIAIIVDDPDAPMGTFTHWVVWSIPADTEKIMENTSIGFTGTNDFGSLGYSGPCPPLGSQHRYYFRVYALDKELAINSGTSREDIDEHISSHIIGYGELMGVYKR